MAAATASGVLGTCFAQGTLEPIHITFDGQPRGTAVVVEQYFESNVWFRPLGIVGPGNGFVRQGGGYAGFPEDGTAYLQAGEGSTLMCSFLDGSVFDLVAVDLAEYSTVFPTPLAVPFVGYRMDGSLVNGSFTTDGIIDGTGPVADFETFTFGQEFSNLLRVEIPTYGWSLDNLHLVRHAPEPSAAALLLTGCLLLLANRRKPR